MISRKRNTRNFTFRLLLFGLIALSIITIAAPAVSAVNEISAERNILQDQPIKPGENFTVVVNISSNQEDLCALSLNEELPDGWTLNPVDDDGAEFNGTSLFKASTNEWVWAENFYAGSQKTVTYEVNVPSNTVLGNYTINGEVSAYGVDYIEISGDTVVSVTDDGDACMVSFSVESAMLIPGSSEDLQLIVDELPTGLAGYNITVYVQDPSIAEINAISFPSWAVLNSNSSLPSDSLLITAVDLISGVNEGDSNVELATISVVGKEIGATDVKIIVTQMDDDAGNMVVPIVISCKVEVTVTIFPGCSNYPTDVDGDGLYEDINGNGRKDFDDIVKYYKNMSWIPANVPVAFFDYNGNGRIDFNDVVELYELM